MITTRGGGVRHVIALSSSFSEIPLATEPTAAAAAAVENVDRDLEDTARSVADTIRTQPRWEKTLLSRYPHSHLFHPRCADLVLRRSLSNPLLSFRYFLFLSSSSSSSTTTTTTASFLLLHSLLAAKAWGPAMHLLRSTKCPTDPHTRNAALSASLRAGRTDLFWQLYQHLPPLEPDPSTAGHLVRALCLDGKPLDAYKLIRSSGGGSSLLLPDVFSFNVLVSALSKIRKFDLVSEILHMMVSSGRTPNIFTYTPVLHGLCCCGMTDEAMRVLTQLKLRGHEPDVVAYTAVIDGLCKMGRMEEAWELWSEMIGRGIVPGQKSYFVLINGYCRSGDLARAEEVYKEMSLRYGECLVGCNIMIAGLCLHGKVREAIDVATSMRRKGIEHDVVTYNTLIQGLCKVGKTTEALVFYRGLVGSGIQPTASTYAPLIASLCSKGNVTGAAELMKDMEARGLEPLSRTADCIILGLCKADRAEEGLEWLVEMLKTKRRPQPETLNELVEFFSSVGRVDDALLVLNALFEMSYSLEKPVCNLLVDKLCSRDNIVLSEQVLSQILLTS